MIDRVAVERRQGGALRRLVVEMLSRLPGFPARTVTRALHLEILETLLPAEAAARRLIEILASALTVTPSTRKSVPPSGPIPKGEGKRERAPTFGLFDPRKHPKPQPEGGGRQRVFVPGIGPSAAVIGSGDRPSRPAAPPPILPDDEIDATMLCRRIAALEAALADLPKQARRLARIHANGRSKWKRVMRPGRPPGHRKDGCRLVDEVLRDCHWFALEALRETAGDPVPP